jgi:hypothetical protein
MKKRRYDRVKRRKERGGRKILTKDASGGSEKRGRAQNKTGGVVPRNTHKKITTTDTQI